MNQGRISAAGEKITNRGNGEIFQIPNILEISGRDTLGEENQHKFYFAAKEPRFIHRSIPSILSSTSEYNCLNFSIFSSEVSQ